MQAADFLDDKATLSQASSELARLAFPIHAAPTKAAAASDTEVGDKEQAELQSENAGYALQVCPATRVCFFFHNVHSVHCTLSLHITQARFFCGQVNRVMPCMVGNVSLPVVCTTRAVFDLPMFDAPTCAP